MKSRCICNEIIWYVTVLVCYRCVIGMLLCYIIWHYTTLLYIYLLYYMTLCYMMLYYTILHYHYYMTLYYIIISQIVFCHCIYIYTSVVKLLSKWSYYILWTWIYEGTIWKGCEETGSTLTIQAHGSSRCFPIKSLVRDVPRVQNVRTHPYFRVGWDAAWPSLHGSWLLFEIEHMSTTRESVWKFKGNSVDRHVPYWDGQFRGW
jgi:hypothetical protein